MTIERELEKLIVANPDFEEVERSQDVFCPFEAVGMVRQEIRHGHFLAYCLDPQRPHGFGSECLRALLRAAAYSQGPEADDGASSGLSALDIHLMDFEKTQVRREWRRIDLLAAVRDEKLVVAIELKIDSSEHGDQLRRYRDIVAENWPEGDGWRHLFLYLTKHGNEASEEDGEGWVSLPLELVARELDRVVERQTGAPEALDLLRSYLSMLRRHHLTEEKLEELAARLWDQHREALDFLMERRPAGSSGMFAEIFDRRNEVAAAMSAAAGVTVVPDDSSVSIVRFAVTEWDDLPKFRTAQNWTSTNRLLLIEFQGNHGKSRLRMRFVLGPSDQQTRSMYLRALIEGGAPTTNKTKISDAFTRLATKSMALTEDEDGEDVSVTYDRVLESAKRYAQEIIPSYNSALAPLRG